MTACTVMEAAKRLGVHHSALRRAARAMGLKLPKDARLSDADLEGLKGAVGDRYIPPPAWTDADARLRLADVEREMGWRAGAARERLARFGITPVKVGASRNAPTTISKQQLEQLKEVELAALDARIEPDDLVSIPEAARMLGISISATHGGMRRQGVQVVKRGRCCYVPLAAVEAYHGRRVYLPEAEPRIERPRGWLTVYAAADELACDRTAVPHMIRRGDLEAVVVGKTLFISPASVAALRDKRQPPPPGWVGISELTAEGPGKPHDWLKRHAPGEMRVFARPGFGARAAYVSPAGAAAYRRRQRDGRADRWQSRGEL